MKNPVAAGLILFLVSAFVPATAWTLTPEEVRLLTEAGVEESIIRIMIDDARPGVREVEDDAGNRYIKYSTGLSRSSDQEETEAVKRAWKLLHNLIIDARP